MLGPHFYYDLLRLARRGRSTLLRVAYVGLLLAILALTAPRDVARHHNEYARAARQFAYPLFVVQYLMVGVLVPVYFGAALAEENKQQTLDLLFMTRLTDWEIALGKLGSRWVQVAGVVLAGLPVLALVQLWGGVEMLLLVYHLAHCLAILLAAGAVSLWLSSLSRRPLDAILASAGMMAGMAQFCFAAVILVDPYSTLLDAPPLARWGLPLLALAGYGVAALGCCWLTARRLRSLRRDLVRKQLAGAGPAGRRRVAPDPHQPPLPLLRHRFFEPPPVSDEALFWKECEFDRPLGRYHGRTAVAVLGLLGVFLLLGVVLYWAVYAQDPGAVRMDNWTALFTFLFCMGYGLTLLALPLAVMFLATRTVAREREGRTLDFLLLLPIERREILLKKALSCAYHVWPVLALLGLCVLFGAACDLVPWWGAVVMLLVPLPPLALVGALGIYLSVRCRTVLVANVTMVLLVLAVLAAHVFVLANEHPFVVLVEALWPGPLPRDSELRAMVGLLAVDEVLALGLTVVLGLLAYRRFQRDAGTAA